LPARPRGAANADHSSRRAWQACGRTDENRIDLWRAPERLFAFLVAPERGRGRVWYSLPVSPPRKNHGRQRSAPRSPSRAAPSPGTAIFGGRSRALEVPMGRESTDQSSSPAGRWPALAAASFSAALDALFHLRITSRRDSSRARIGPRRCLRQMGSKATGRACRAARRVIAPAGNALENTVLCGPRQMGSNGGRATPIGRQGRPRARARTPGGPQAYSRAQ